MAGQRVARPMAQHDGASRRRNAVMERTGGQRPPLCINVGVIAGSLIVGHRLSRTTVLSSRQRRAWKALARGSARAPISARTAAVCRSGHSGWRKPNWDIFRYSSPRKARCWREAKRESRVAMASLEDDLASSNTFNLSANDLCNSCGESGTG